MFYHVNDNGELMTANFQVDNTWIETDRETVYGWDGKLYFKGEEPAEPAERIQKRNIAALTSVEARLAAMEDALAEMMMEDA